MGEYTLPGQAPVSVVYPQEHQVDVDHGYNNVLGQNDDVVMEEPDPLEVTLNIDLPKTTRSAEGEPSTTVLHVNPSWHCVFVETVQQERIRCWIRIQFCGSPKQMEHRALVCKLQSLQVIGYQSRQVELTRRICGKRLLNKGGIIIHLDPVAINYNDASYGFTVSLSSYPCDRLDRRLRPDEPLPLTRQQNSAFCRRNLKELYNDTFSKDVVVTLSPSREQFYVHSVVLENYGYFRKLSEEQGNGGDRQSPFRLRRQGSSRVGLSSFSSTLTGVGDVDEDGFAQPLNMSSQLASQLQQQQQQQQESDANQGSTSSASAPLPPPLQSPPPPPALNRPRISLQVEGTSPNVFRAILHFMYMGHIPTTAASCFQSVVIPSTTSTGTPTAQPRAVETTGASTSAAPAAEPTSTTVAPSSAVATPAPVPTPAPGSAAAVETTSPFDFSWTELYDTAVRFQLVGLTRLARLVLISRLDTGSAVHELMTWAYQHDTLIPCYLSYIIETVHPDQFKDSSRGSQSNPQMNAAATISRANSESNNSSSTSVLWSYRDKCPKFGDILLKIVQMLDERRPVFTTL
ncbi:hypothetical protein BGZ83_009196 [Gryganskiella cystojenkinii]|nr:hypothetical protein BGZ83_009196 [Gryganskiella cystojenkinii]